MQQQDARREGVAERPEQLAEKNTHERPHLCRRGVVGGLQ